MESKNIKQGDFVEIDYTGTIKDGNIVFDTTQKEVAMANSLNKEAKYEPIVICIGQGFILPHIEIELVGKKIGKYTFDLMPEQSFGKKSAALLKLVPMKVFRQQEIMPYNGLEVNIDGQFGIIRNVSGGRVIVDFNHPIAGRDLKYDVEVKKFVTDDKEKLEALLKASGLPYDSASVKENKAMIVISQPIADQVKAVFEEHAKKLIGIKKTDYVLKQTKEQK
ncbi:MAG: peptidylprolyl isomerase [archaeon]